MTTHLFSPDSRPVGRPPVVHLSPEDLRVIQSYYLPTNRSKKDGSIILAWVRFCEGRPDLLPLVRDHMPATTIPAAAVEACRQAKPLIGPARGGERRLRHEAAYVPGTMRRNHFECRRLMAGERASVDDATRNVACWIPWPWGGCPCSDKYGVRLGRWQTLIVHDDASSYIPFVSSVFRFCQSYRATDAASIIYRTETGVCEFDAWSIEGGVWQTRRVLDILAGRFISAKGRPNQKLVESYINRLWGVMAGQPGDVGRHQAELKSTSDTYVQCRAGRKDPRLQFLPLTEAQNQLYAAITWLSEKRIDSRTYGSWVPKSRWEADMIEHPRQPRQDAHDFLILPCAEVRKVSNGSVRVTEDGPQGVRMVWTFAADWLYKYTGREVVVYFDPLSAWPVTATLTLPGRREPLGTAECISPIGETRDHAAEITKAIRSSMMTETRNLTTLHTARQIRHPEGVILHSSGPSDPSDPAVSTTSPRPLREPLAPAPRVTRDDLAAALSRRASRLRDPSLTTP